MGRPYNVLLDKPPVTATVNGREYEVNTDFRVVLAYLRLASGEDEEDEKALYGFELFFGDEVARDDIKGLCDWRKWFVSRGEEKKEESTEAAIFDLLVDSGRIYAAFYQAYGINLRKVKMHWWVFVELLNGLPQGTKLADVIEIRQKPFEKWMTPAQKNALQRLKDHYAIGEKKDPMDVFASAMRGLFGKKR